MGLILGIDICDDYSQISAFNRQTGEPEEISSGSPVMLDRIPTVICKRKGEDAWLIGAEAYKTALLGGGVLVDRLVALILKRGTATIEDVKYNSEYFMNRYITSLVNLARDACGAQEVESVVFTTMDLDPRVNDYFIRGAVFAGIEREKVHIYSHTETFAHYVLAQQGDIWTNQVSLFDLRTTGLYYYELRVMRGRKPWVIEATREKLPESFSPDVLGSPSGEKFADTILASCAQRVLDKKTVTSVILTGRGFTATDWAKDFLTVICNRRRVFQSNQIFAQGAAYAAMDLVADETRYPYLFSCEGRLSSSVGLYAVYDGRRELINLAKAGTNWYEAAAKASFILDDLHCIELVVTQTATGRSSIIEVSLDELPARPNKTTRIELAVAFASENKMTVRVYDRGFGDLFPSSDKIIKQDCILP